MKTLLIVLVALVLLCLGTWILGISETTVGELMALPLSDQGIHIATEGLTKGMFYSLTMQKATLVQHDSTGRTLPLLAVTDVSAHLDLGSLLVLRPRIDVKGAVGDGALTGSIALRASDETKVRAISVPLSQVPFVSLRGIRGEGTLSWDFSMKSDTGELKLRIDNARLTSASVEGVALPLDMFHEIRGLFIIGKDATEIRSLALEGKGIYARLKGTIQKGELASTLEVSVDTSVRENLLVAAMIERYKVSPGYYEIPVSRRLPSFVSH